MFAVKLPHLWSYGYPFWVIISNIWGNLAHCHWVMVSQYLRSNHFLMQIYIHGNSKVLQCAHFCLTFWSFWPILTCIPQFQHFVPSSPFCSKFNILGQFHHFWPTSPLCMRHSFLWGYLYNHFIWMLGGIFVLPLLVLTAHVSLHPSF